MGEDGKMLFADTKKLHPNARDSAELCLPANARDSVRHRTKVSSILSANGWPADASTRSIRRLPQ
jgi:hypothetical protein